MFLTWFSIMISYSGINPDSYLVFNNDLLFMINPVSYLVSIMISYSGINPVSYLVSMISFSGINPVSYLVSIMISYSGINPVSYLVSMISFSGINPVSYLVFNNDLLIGWVIIAFIPSEMNFLTRRGN